MDQAANLRKMVKLEAYKRHKRQEGCGHGGTTGGGQPKVITIASGKGGVGKTNVVVNLGIACQRMGKKVLIFDADLGLANIDIIFGLDPKHSIEEIISGEMELSEVIVEGPEGVAVIPASSGVQELTDLTEGQKMHLLNEFDMLNNRYDILLIDTGAGVSSNVTYFNMAAEERIIVVTPEPTSITDAYALMKILFSRHGVKHFHVLMNMVSGEKEARCVYNNLSSVLSRFMGGISLDYAGHIPRDQRLMQSVARRKPVMSSFPQASSSKGFESLARYIIQPQSGHPTDGNIKFFWKRLMSGAQELSHEGHAR